jgi:hypothetical protein
MKFSNRILSYAGKSRGAPHFIFEPPNSAADAINPRSTALPGDKFKEAFAQ